MTIFDGSGEPRWALGALLLSACGAGEAHGVVTNLRTTIEAPDDAGKTSGTGDDGARAKSPLTRSTAEATANRARCLYERGALPRDTLGPTARLGTSLPIEHIIVLMQENRSFDHYFGHLGAYETAHGIPNDLEDLPAGASNPGYPVGQPGASTLPRTDFLPHPAAHAAKLCSFDTAHLWADAHLAYDHGRNDGFYFASSGVGDPNESVQGIAPEYLDGARALAWYDARDLPFDYDLYSTFAIGDRYFADVLGPTFPNRMYLYAATSFGQTNNDFPDLSDYPYPGKGDDPGLVFDALEARGVSWGIYSEAAPAIGVVLGTTVKDRYGPGRAHDVTDFLADAAAGTLPEVSFVDANFTVGGAGSDDEHPPAEIELGQHFVWKIVHAVTTSPNWATSALFVTYDENGGFYDHVPPPTACKPDERTPIYGSPFDAAEPAAFDRYGFRVPFVVVSPYAKPSFASHAVYSHASITRFIEAKTGVGALTARDANADPFSDLFDWDAPRFLTPPVFAEPKIDEAAVDACRAALDPTSK